MQSTSRFRPFWVYKARLGAAAADAEPAVSGGVGSSDFNTERARRFDHTAMAHDGFKAKYSGTCAVCGNPIRKGVDFVVQHPGLGKYVHEMCPL